MRPRNILLLKLELLNDLLVGLSQCLELGDLLLVLGQQLLQLIVLATVFVLDFLRRCTSQLLFIFNVTSHLMLVVVDFLQPFLKLVDLALCVCQFVRPFCGKLLG